MVHHFSAEVKKGLVMESNEMPQEDMVAISYQNYKHNKPHEWVVSVSLIGDKTSFFFQDKDDVLRFLSSMAAQSTELSAELAVKIRNEREMANCLQS
jgi:hypothetical protein